MQLLTELEFLSDWRIGAGTGSTGADRSIRRGDDDLPFVPAKSITGVLRDEAFAIAHGLGGKWPEVAATVFGTRGGNNALIAFRPLRLDDALAALIRANRIVRQYFTFNRMSVTLDDDGLAEKEKLFVTELGRQGIRFRGTAEIDEIGDHGLALVLVAAQRMRRIGGSRRRGLGKCTFTLDVDKNLPTLDLPKLLSEGNPTIPARPRSQQVIPDSTASAGAEFVDITVDIELEAPVVALERTIGNVRTSHTFVPGTMLLGPLVKAAGGWPVLGGLVFSSEIQVRNAYPVMDGLRLLPSPHALFRKKRAAKADPYHNALTGGELAGLKPQRGEYVAEADNAATIVVHDQALTHFTHAVIHPVTQRPESDVGGVYTYRALPKGTRLRSTMRLPTAAADAVTNTTVDLRLGASKKDDYGQATATFGAVIDPLPVENTSTLNVWLTSDTLLLNKSLEPEPTAENLVRILSDELGLSTNSGPGLTLEKAYTRSIRREGWSASTGLPRPTMPCLAAGSVIHVSATAGNIDQSALESLQRTGIGERTAEGFGEVVINAAFLAETKLYAAPEGSPPADTASPSIRAEDAWLAAAAAEDAARRIAPLIAPSIVKYLRVLEKPKDKKALSKTQLGSLREATAQLRTDKHALRKWADAVEGNVRRQGRWGHVLPLVRSVSKDPSYSVLGALTAEEASAVALLFELANDDASTRTMRSVVSLLLTEGLRYALVEQGKS